MEKLGIDPKLLFTQIVNFAIMVIILTKLLYKPLLKTLAERKKKIEAGLAFAERAKAEEAKLVAKQQEMLKETREESRVILENAKKEGKKIKEDLVASGKAEVEAVRIRMDKELQAKYAELEKQLVAQTVGISAEMVKKLLPSLLSDEAQHKLITQELTKLEKDHAK